MIYVCLAGIVVFLALFFLNLWDLNRFTVTEYCITDSKIRSAISFAVLADLHNKDYGKENRKLVDSIKQLKPDAILCVGDIMTASPGEDFIVAASLMQTLAKNYPVYYAIGNHEYRAGLYPEKYQTLYQDYFAVLKKAKVQVLIDERVFLTKENVDICGLELERQYYKRFATRKMDENVLKMQLGEPKSDAYQILLAHNPEYCPEYAMWGADLTLCGHIHGGLIRIPFWGGVASPAVKFFPRYNGGLYKLKKRLAIVSRGLGTHTVPLRLFDPGELIIVRLNPAIEDSLQKDTKISTIKKHVIRLKHR